MRNNDDKNTAKEQANALMMQAFKDNDPEAYAKALEQLMEAVGQDVRREYEEHMASVIDQQDEKILQARGVRQLTSAEKKFYQALRDASKLANPKMGLTDVIMPETIIDSVFDEMQTRHPLLAKVGFLQTGGAIRMYLNTNGYQEARWGTLCSEIVQEAMSGFKEVDTGLLKLSAFLPVCKANLDLGYEWLDNFVRQVLYEMLANGLENGIVNGTGKDEPIGMIRDVSENAAVVGGKYPAKAKVTVNDFSAETIGNLLSLLAVDPNGKPREVRDVILLVNPADYFSKIMPATTLMAPDGSYRNDVLPYPMEIIQTAAVKPGEAVLGMAYKYFAAVGMSSKDGRIEYSDQYQFLEDNRVYVIKLYANGFPIDNNAFAYLDISNLRAAVLKVEQVTAPDPSADATLSSLKIGALALSPNFAAGTTTYTAATTNGSNVINAVPNNAGATIEVKVNDEVIANGTAATWKSGSNTVEITVTAKDGTTTKKYTVTVTKS